MVGLAEVTEATEVTEVELDRVVVASVVEELVVARAEVEAAADGLEPLIAEKGNGSSDVVRWVSQQFVPPSP